ncbi:rhamnosyltransferase WsaF family glycosyltransferase [Vibrio cholerae]|uniref:rhamnosyltransferase WsaF family glycosyltransferase n=1 Tax=Vibrio cholerae TaxID=666 RepID=UPI003966B629
MKAINEILSYIVNVIFPNRRLKHLLDYSLTDEEIRLNNEVVYGNQDNILELKSALWFLPKIGNINAGGIVTILKIADHLTKTSGCKNYFIFSNGDLNKYHRDISLLYPELNFEIMQSSLEKENIDRLPRTNIGICTFWTTAFSLAKYNKCDKKFYLIQDDERCFYEYGSTRELVESTFRMGFKGIINSDYVYNLYKSYSHASSYRYYPGVNEYYYCDNKNINEDIINVVVYCRPSHSRNCFETIIVSIKSVAETLKGRVVFHLVGENINRKSYKLPENCIVHGHVSNESELKKLYNICNFGVSFISTPTISYHQLDLIQSRVCLIANKNMEIENIFHPGEVLYSEPTPNALATLILNLVNDHDMVRDAINKSSEKLKIFNWCNCLTNIETFIRNE